jgi:N utilization substance protein B
VPEWGSRRRARERALQFLYGLDLTKYSWDIAFEEFWAMAPSRPGVRNYTRTLVEGICTRRDELDAEIYAAIQKWTPDRVGHIERNILRIALFEMRCVDDVPAAVAMNEAIELAKMYGAEEAPRFVNGVLDRLRSGRS